MNIKISYNWLKEYIKTNKSVQDFVKEFSLKSQTIDRIEEIGQGLDGVVIGKMLEIKKHPNADKLNVAKVDIGKKEPLELIFGQVVELKVGDQLPIAVAPTKLPGGLEIKAREMRGVVSQGMCCLDSELGLSDQDRVTFFPKEIKPGLPITQALSLRADYLLEIEVTANRPDAMSVVGLAREAAAVLGTKFDLKVPKPNLKIAKNIPLSVQVLEPKLCLRYNAVVMTDVKVGPSPLWLQLRLIFAGLRPINNLVDITNYILLEYGRPMHVFDYEKLNGQKIIVRLAKRGEKILALDGKTYELRPHHLVIADSKEPVAVGGIMGGELSAATEKTKTIVFECAAFDPVLIRKTARELNLHSDSSDLFEKNLHPQSTYLGILRAIELTQQLAGGKVASPIIDVGVKNYAAKKIKFDLASIKRYLGLEIPVTTVKKILTSLGFTVSGTKTLSVAVPWWRANDVVFDYDLVEEVARIYGFANLPSRLPQGQIPVEQPNLEFFWEDVCKDTLAGLGFCEVYNYSMLSEKLLAKVFFPASQALRINNPLNEEFEYLRTTLLAGILQNVSDNSKNFADQKIFELSNVYLPTKANDLPQELPKLTGAIVSNANDAFFQAKGVVELLLKKLGINNYKLVLTDSACPLWAKGQALDVILGKEFLGQFGLVKQNILDNFGLKKPARLAEDGESRRVALFDFDFKVLVKLATAVKSYQPIPEFPGVTRDLAVVINKTLSWQEIRDLANQVNQLIVDIEYLSTFTDDSIGTGKKSLAFRLTFRAADRTLKSEEVDEVIKKIIEKLQKEFGAKLR